MFDSKEEKAILIMAREISNKFNCKCDFIEHEGNSYLYIHNKKNRFTFNYMLYGWREMHKNRRSDNRYSI